MNLLNVAACGLLLAACTSTSSTEVGDVTISTHTLHVTREGDPATAGVMTRFVIKPSSGGNPTSIKAWVGLGDAGATAKFAAEYDATDGDYDADVTVPSPLPSGSELWLDVETSGTTMSGSLGLK